jgi:MYXO-CTERM domain-containing protein
MAGMRFTTLPLLLLWLLPANAQAESDPRCYSRLDDTLVLVPEGFECLSFSLRTDCAVTTFMDIENHCGRDLTIMDNRCSSCSPLPPGDGATIDFGGTDYGSYQHDVSVDLGDGPAQVRVRYTVVYAPTGQEHSSCSIAQPGGGSAGSALTLAGLGLAFWLERRRRSHARK